MDTHRSHPSYSDDFEQEIESPQNSPRSEEKVEIKVFKSSVGPLTVHPKKVAKNGNNTKEGAPQRTASKNRTGRTLSELSVLSTKAKASDSGRNRLPNSASTNTKQGKNNGSSTAIVKVGRRNSISSVKANESKSSLGGRIGLRTGTVLKNKALAQEKIEPHELPASIAPSASSLSLHRLNLQRNLSRGGAGTASTIRRVMAHTTIKEKSYPSAKYKTYATPPTFRGGGGIGMYSYGRGGIAKATSVAQRVASAKRLTIMDLKSKIKMLEDEIEALKKENRFLNHLHHRQDNALRRWEGKDAELPRLLNQHKDEIRSLQEQLRRAQQNSRDFNEKLAGRDRKILRLENELEKLRSLVHEEHLQDRHTLQEELDITRMNLAGAEKRIREYMRHVDILEKNHRHQLAAQERKLIKVNTHTYELQQIVANLKLALRNKDRMLNYIQMRASGRNLIRAYHAEGHNPEDMYAARLMQDINRPYQQPPLQKSQSYVFENSRCTTPYLEDSNREKYIDGGSGDGSMKRNSFDDHMTRNRMQQKNQHPQEKDRAQRKKQPEVLPDSPMYLTPKRSQSLESRQNSPVSPKAEEKKGKARSVIHKNSSTRKPQKQMKKESKVSEGNKAKKVSNASVKSAPLPKAKGPQKVDAKLINEITRGHQSKQKSKMGKDSKKDGKAIGNKSKELIYEGSSLGFKYEGPFVSTSKTQESTEILYTANSDKLSGRSQTDSSTSCTSNSNSQSHTRTVLSSRSEILSNIDILSARLRESCIKVDPPEETIASSRSRTDEEGKLQTIHSTPRMKDGKQSEGVKDIGNAQNPPVIGPAGDTPVLLQQNTNPIVFTTTPVMSLNIANTDQNAAYQTGYNLQASGQGVVNSPKSQHAFVQSPRLQQYSISIPNLNSAQQPAQYQLQQQQQQGPNPQTSYVQLGGSVLNQVMGSPNNSPQPSPHVTIGTIQDQQQQQQQQVQFSPRLQNIGAATYNLVSTTTADGQTSLLASPQQVPQQQQQQGPRYLDYQYFSLVSPRQELQAPQGSSTRVAFIQAGQVFDSNPVSSRSTNYATTFYTTQPPQQQQQQQPTQATTFPPVGYFNPGMGAENSNENVNSPNKNQPNPTYNPSYYANLGSWK